MATTHKSLVGEVALVTGAGKRIGRAIALELAAAGAHVLVHVNSSAAEGEATISEIEHAGGRAALLRADQRSVPAIEAACAEAPKFFGPVSILVNSAAIWPHCTLETTGQEEFDLAIEVNLRGPFFWARYLGPEMKRRGGGCIVNLADVDTDRPRLEGLPYTLSKAGVISMTYGLAKALAPQVRVSAIGPGPILFPPDYPQDRIDEDRRRTLRGREGKPEDIARTVRFLCESPNITGVFLPVDGGFRFGI